MIVKLRNQGIVALIYENRYYGLDKLWVNIS